MAITTIPVILCQEACFARRALVHLFSDIQGMVLAQYRGEYTFCVPEACDLGTGDKCPECRGPKIARESFLLALIEDPILPQLRSPNPFNLDTGAELLKLYYHTTS